VLLVASLASGMTEVRTEVKALLAAYDLLLQDLDRSRHWSALPRSRWLYSVFATRHMHRVLTDLGARSSRRALIARDAQGAADAKAIEDFLKASPQPGGQKSVALGFVVAFVVLLPLAAGAYSTQISTLVSSLVSVDGPAISASLAAIDPQIVYRALLNILCLVAILAIIPLTSFWRLRIDLGAFGSTSPDNALQAEKASFTRYSAKPPRGIPFDIILVGGFVFFLSLGVPFVILDVSDNQWTVQQLFSIGPGILFALMLQQLLHNRRTGGRLLPRNRIRGAVIGAAVFLIVPFAAAEWNYASEPDFSLTEVSIVARGVDLADFAESNDYSLDSQNVDLLGLDTYPRDPDKPTEIEGIAVHYSGTGGATCDCIVSASVYDATTGNRLTEEWATTYWPVGAEFAGASSISGSTWSPAPPEGGSYFIRIEVNKREIAFTRDQIPANHDFRGPFVVKDVNGDATTTRYYNHFAPFDFRDTGEFTLTHQ